MTLITFQTLIFIVGRSSVGFGSFWKKLRNFGSKLTEDFRLEGSKSMKILTVELAKIFGHTKALEQERGLLSVEGSNIEKEMKRNVTWGKLQK